MSDATHNTYRVAWSAEDGEHVAAVFRPGATPGADRAAMLACRRNPAVIRIGRVHRAHHEGPLGALAATVVTRAMTGTRPENLVTRLRAASEVISAGFPD